ncbi:class I SAM-dependent DNA methyltransferase [Campylobacter lari]|uniref:site-specific DNA-methyltransferase (adenine-specific) n=1 Tax=Campylobacter lari TaxID=201 RepID=A0A7U8AP86_CAMLA|nr:class I SAM-dependent DNA methyltransferase [Campylobacter lari]
MRFDLIPLQEFIKNNAKTPTKDIIKDFKVKINEFLSQASKANEEDYQKKEISNFLEKTYNYKTNIKGNIDLTIYVDDIANVIFEIKSTINKKEFPQSNQDLSSKAFYESVLYFLRERKGNKNNFIKFIIICTAKDFFIIDAKEYEKLFENDKTIIRHYKNCDEKQGTNTKTQEFYDQLSSYLKTLDKNLKYTHFELRDDLDETTLSYIYQILSPQVLLKEKTTQDANALNENFYKELLYILGLKEEGDKSKKIILSDTPNTLSHAIRQTYKDISFDDIFALLITWNNRILFLRLFESMLLSFNHMQKPFLTIEKIPNFAKLSELFFEVLAKKENQRSIKEFDFIPYLNSSLFDKNTQEQQHKDIRLLDSKPLEIFQNSKLAQEYKDLKSLPLLEYLFAFLRTYDFTTTSKDIQDNQKINHDKLINASVLGNVFEKLNGYKEGSYYTPSFITSYMCKQSIEKVVLDKFEQEHSLKASSISDLRVLIDRNFTLEKQKAYLDTILSIKICDPAVGSGHFLVSALNELVYILYQLGLIKSLLREKLILENDELIIYTNDKGIFNYQKPNFQNDPIHQIQKELFECKKLIIENCLFGVDINPNSCEITKLRLWIELLKYSFYIFENDKNTNTLQILPNIDINIKCRNSLISYFSADRNFSNYPNIKESINQYKQAVKDYKEGFYENKAKLLEKILHIKESFKNFCLKDIYANKIKNLVRDANKYSEKYGDYLAQDELDPKFKFLFSKNVFEIDFDKTQAKKEFEALKSSYENIFNLERFNPFEWRFEFPEILDENGNFKGFDLIIGNPPYISAPSQLENENLALQRQTIADLKKYKSLYQKWDLYIPFIELGISELCKENAICAMIIPYPFTNQLYAKLSRDMITTEFNLYELTDLQDVKVFDNAVVINCIVFISKNKFQNNITISGIDENLQIHAFLDKTYDNLIQDKKTLVFNTTSQERKIDKHKDLNTLGDFCYISKGMVLNADEKTAKGEFKKDDLISNTKDKIHCKEYIEAKDIEKYTIKRIRYLEYNTPRSPSKLSRPTFPQLYENEKIMVNTLGNINCVFDTNNIIHNHSLTSCVLWKNLKGVENKSISGSIKKFSRFSRDELEKLSLDMNLKYILGILNSEYANILLTNIRGDAKNIYPEYIRNIPIPKINSKNEKLANELISLVDEILNLKERDKNTNTKTQEDKINSIVYKLYNLSKEEIKIIEGK